MSRPRRPAIPYDGGYVRRIGAAARALKAQRLMPQEDVDRVIQEAAQSDVLR